MIPVFFLWVSVATPSNAALEEPAWRELSEDFRIGYIWGILDATAAKAWDYELPKGKRPEIYWQFRKSVDTHIADCIHKKELSPFQLETMLNDYVARHPADKGDSIFGMIKHLIWRTCMPPIENTDSNDNR